MATRQKTHSWDSFPERRPHWEGHGPDHAKVALRLLKHKGQLLDLGCGSGQDALFFVKQGFEVWGIDKSGEAIRRADKQCHIRGVRFLVGDYTSLPFRSGFFHYVYSRYSLQFVPQGRIAPEILRVLQQNGLAYLAFILDMKMIMTRDFHAFQRRDDVIASYKNFQILSQEEFRIIDFVGERSHLHNCMALSLRKPSV
jgi:ubiquinone/menaquinone biosynthesis C-methylase UbiE